MLWWALGGARRILARPVRPVTALLAALVMVASTSAAAWAYEPGVDVSGYQHSTSLDWSQVQASGVEFAYLKATEGRTYTNPYFAADWAATTGLGLYRGAYHYAWPSSGTAVAQATYFVSVAGLADQPGDLPPVLDLENHGSLGVAALRTWTANFLSTVESLTGRTPIIYTSPNFWRTYLGDSTAFTRYPLWVAHYTSASQPSLPGGWSTWTFWQNTSSGRVNGISGNVDQDRFNGTLDDLKVLARATDLATPDPTTDPGPVPDPSTDPGTDPVGAPAPDPTTAAPTPLATSTTVTASSTAVPAGHSVLFSGTVLSTDGTPVAGGTTALARRPVGATSWTRVTTGTTDATGHVTLSAVVDQDASYRLRLLPTTSYASSSSTPVAVGVLAPRATAVTIGTMAARVRRGHPVRLYGHLRLADGAGVAGERVVLLARVLGTSRWRQVGTGTSLAPTGWWQVTARPWRPRAYKAVYGGSTQYLPAHSTSVVVRVRR